MTQSLQERLAELDAYLASLDDAERTRQKVKTETDPQKVFDLIQLGDTVGVAIAMQDNNIRPDLTDKNKMTLLHRAAAHDTQLIAAVVMREVSAAPWMRDAFDRLPLDVAREAGHDELGNVLQEITYPELFRDQPETTLSHELIQAYASHSHAFGQPSTALPDLTLDLSIQAIKGQLIRHQHKHQDRER